MPNSPRTPEPKDAADAVLRQYAGAADEDRDQRDVLTPTDVIPGTGSGSAVEQNRKWTRDPIYPLLGSAKDRLPGGGDAAGDLEEK